MASQPQPASPGTPPPPIPELCTECIHPNGTHFFTTISNCQLVGGTAVGDPFDCLESDQRTQQLKEREQAG